MRSSVDRYINCKQIYTLALCMKLRNENEMHDLIVQTENETIGKYKSRRQTITSNKFKRNTLIESNYQ